MASHSTSSLQSLEHLEGRDLAGRILFIVLTLVLSLVLLFVFIQYSGVNKLEAANFPDMVYGKANRPYVNRELLPGAVRLMVSAVPASSRANLNASLGSSPAVLFLLQNFRVSPDYALEALLALVLMYVSLAGFVFTFSKLFRSIYQVHPFLANSISLLCVLFLLPFFGYGYIYDFPTLFLFTLQQLWMHERRWKAYLLLFPLTCLNKETAILLTVVFGLYFYSRLDRKLFTRLVFLQLLIFTVIQVLLFLQFRNNPGGALEYHFGEQILALLKLPLYSVIFFLSFGSVIGLVLYRWKQKPPFLRWAITGILPLLFLYVFFGFPFEIRVFYEFFAVLIMLCIHPLTIYLQKSFASRSFDKHHALPR